jgi:hypothetical protein
VGRGCFVEGWGEINTVRPPSRTGDLRSNKNGDRSPPFLFKVNPVSRLILIESTGTFPVDDKASQALLRRDVSLIPQVKSPPARISTEQSGGFAELEGVHDFCFVGYEESEMKLCVGVSHHISLLVQS